MERHLAGMLLRAATEHVTGTSNDSLAEEAHDSDPHAVDDHGVVDDHGAADGGHGPWWSDSSELVFTSDVTLIPMIVLCVTFEWIHHKLMHWCTHADPATTVQTKAERKNEKRLLKIRRYAEPWILPSVGGVCMDSNGGYSGFEEGGVVDKASDHPFRGSQLQPLMNRMSSEFMVLGFIALTIWVARTAGLFELVVDNLGDRGGPTTAHELVEVAEEVHVALFVSMLLYFLIIFVTVRHLEDVMRRYGDMEKEERAAMLAEGRGGLGLRSVMSRVRTGERVKDPGPISTVFRSGPSSTQGVASGLPQARTTLQYKLHHVMQYDNMRSFFMSYVRAFGPDIGIDCLHDNFDFACYLRVGLDVYMKDLVAVHATTWFIVLLLYAIECVVAATGGLEGKILFVNIGLTVGYNAVGLCIVYLIRLRFGKRLSVESEGQRSWITQFASILPPNAEIYVLRLFQALVMFTSFSLAKFIVAKDSYSAGGEQIPHWLNWAVKVTFLLMLTFLLRHLVPSLNMLLRLPPFLDEHEAEIIILIRDNQSVDMGQLMRNAVKARERGEMEEAETWEKEVQNEVIANLERQHSRISSGAVMEAAMHEDPASARPRLWMGGVAASGRRHIAETPSAGGDGTVVTAPNGTRGGSPGRSASFFGLGGRQHERMLSFHFPRVKERAPSTQDLFGTPAPRPGMHGGSGRRHSGRNSAEDAIVHQMSMGTVERVGHGEVHVHTAHRLHGPVGESGKNFPGVREAGAADPSQPAMHAPTPGTAEAWSAQVSQCVPAEPASDTATREGLVADTLPTLPEQGPQVGPGGARSAAPPSPPKGAAASPLRAMPGADAASGTPTSPGMRVKLAPLPQARSRYSPGAGPVLPRPEPTDQEPTPQVPGVPDEPAPRDSSKAEDRRNVSNGDTH